MRWSDLGDGFDQYWIDSNDGITNAASVIECNLVVLNDGMLI